MSHGHDASIHKYRKTKNTQRASIDEFDRLIGQLASDEGRFTDDRREQSSGQLEATGPLRESFGQRRAWSERCEVHSKNSQE